MTMDEFADMVKQVRNAKVIMGKSDYALSEKEKSSTIFRRSLFAIADIKAGEVFTRENVRSIRPGNGIKPKHLKDLLGKPCKRDIKRGEPITEDLL